MAADEPPTANERFQVKVTADSHFAWFRTRLAVQRTMMAWVRTATALIGFGFTIVQFFEKLHSMTADIAPVVSSFATRYVGLVLIGAGIAVLVIATLQYRAVIRYLWHGDFAQIAGVGEAPGHTPVYAIAIGLALIGLLAFFLAFLSVLTPAV